MNKRIDFEITPVNGEMVRFNGIEEGKSTVLIHTGMVLITIEDGGSKFSFVNPSSVVETVRNDND